MSLGGDLGDMSKPFLVEVCLFPSNPKSPRDATPHALATRAFNQNLFKSREKCSCTREPHVVFV